MSSCIKFYTIAVEEKDTKNVTDYPIKKFFKDINGFLLENKDNQKKLVRQLGDKIITQFPISYKMGIDIFVVPFGKLKDKNKPYWLNNQNKLEEVKQNLFDLNSLAYDPNNNVMAFTTNRDGPDWRIVEEYLTTFIPTDLNLKVSITPMYKNMGIEKIRSAELVRSITINLDLGHSLNSLFLKEEAIHKDKSVKKTFNEMITDSKEIVNGKTFTITLGLGQSAKKEDTLSLDSILELLEEINIASDVVKEVYVNYKNNEQKKVQLARLKQSSIIVSHDYPKGLSQIGPEYLLNNADEAFTEHRNEYRSTRDHYFLNTISSSNSIEILKEFDPKEYYKE